MGIQVKVGDEREETVVEDLTRTQLVQYAGASGDYNPVHTDQVFATEVAGFPSVFAHGMLSMGLTGKVVTSWFGADKVTKFGVRFVKQVWPGDTLTAKATVDAIREEGGKSYADLTVVTVNQNGDEVIRGSATAAL